MALPVVVGVVVLSLVACVLGAYVLYRVIRSAISEGMKDYALWKIQLDAELSEQDELRGEPSGPGAGVPFAYQNEAEPTDVKW